jgi:aminobenzoyl-glutamate transport protein
MSEEITAVPPVPPPRPRGWTDRALDIIEWAGNKLPDPAVIFVLALVLTWIASALLAPVEFTEIDPRTMGTNEYGIAKPGEPIRIVNQLTGPALVRFLSRMVKTFTDFPPLGLVLVALLGVGVAEHTGFINACLKGLLSITPLKLLTPMTMLVAILSHAAGDSGYVLVIPLGGVIYAAAGRHPLAGIAVAFAGVSGGLSANFIPIALDPLLQGFTQSAAQLLEPGRQVNPLCNLFFTSTSTGLLILLAWYITDRIVEPRLANATVDGDASDMPRMDPLTPRERTGMIAGLAAIGIALGGLLASALPEESPWRIGEQRVLMAAGAPLMEAIIPLMFLLFLLPGLVYGYVAGTVKSHRDIIQGMTKSMGTMAYYLVLAFFAAQFLYVFRESNVGILIAMKGAEFLVRMQVPLEVTIVGVILISTIFNLLIGSASAKWALLGPILVPMMMRLGISPEMTQAAYRIGDSCTNIITPLMPYFPLVVVFCRRYVKGTGIGTLVSIMMPYSIAFLAFWTVLLLGFWTLNVPLGLEAPYTYP